jgi:hypothetical protein
MRLEDIEFKDQRALTLLLDVAHLLGAAAAASQDGSKATLSRAAAMTAAVFLECVSNSCLLSLALPSRVAEELDRLPTMAKLDYYLFAKTTQHIDRGCRETELAAEVLKLRDHLVHPKPNGGKIAGEPPMQYVDYGSTNSLKVPYDTRLWTPVISENIAKSVTSFGAKYFIDWCRMDKGQITSILLAHEKQIIQGSIPTWVRVDTNDFSLIARYLPESLKFLDIRDRDTDA